MPEILEVERYRRAARPTIGRTIEIVDAPDDWFLKGVDATTLRAVAEGVTIVDVARRGKLMLLETSGPTIGLRFGMTGRLVVDDEAPIEELQYSSNRQDPAWRRFELRFADGGSLAIVDPRRLGGVELDPDPELLGPDAWSVDDTSLASALARGRGPLKARLLDQNRIAGLGNLLVDETLWRAGLAPGRPAGDLDAAELTGLAETIRTVLDDLDERGGSHTGDLQPHRTRGASCPRDGEPLCRETIGGRTTYWCPRHQG